MTPELDKSIIATLNHTLNGNNNDKLTGMLWRLNELMYVNGPCKLHFKDKIFNIFK